MRDGVLASGIGMRVLVRFGSSWIRCRQLPGPGPTAHLDGGRQRVQRLLRRRQVGAADGEVGDAAAGRPCSRQRGIHHQERACGQRGGGMPASAAACLCRLPTGDSDGPHLAPACGPSVASFCHQLLSSSTTATGPAAQQQQSSAASVAHKANAAARNRVALNSSSALQ